MSFEEFKFNCKICRTTHHKQQQQQQQQQQHYVNKHNSKRFLNVGNFKPRSSDMFSFNVSNILICINRIVIIFKEKVETHLLSTRI